MKQTLEQLAHEHRGLMELVDTIEKQLNCEPASFVVSSLTEPISALRNTVRAHFEWEEGSNLFIKLPEEMPELAPEIEGLRVQHRAISEALDQAVYHLRNTDDGARALDEVSSLPAKLSETMQMIRKHERHENQVLQNAFLRDTGTGD